MKQYVLGFTFNYSLSQGLLIRKQRPDWQKGRLNGLGGKVEKAEEPLAAMIREYAEECGLVSVPAEWSYFALLSGPHSQVHCFTAQMPLGTVFQTTDETLATLTLPLPTEEKFCDHVEWLLALARETIYIRDRGLKTPFTTMFCPN